MAEPAETGQASRPEGRPPSLGEQELEILRFISQHAPVTAGRVVDGYGEERGLARSTILTVIERLRKKGYVTRRKRAGVYHFSARQSQTEVLQGLVHRFVETTLGGSVAPVVAYLSHTRRLTQPELAELQRLADDLKRREEQEEQP